MYNNAVIAEENSAASGPEEEKDFETLVRENHRELLVYALALTKNPATAQDIVQDSFVIAFEKQDTFDVTRDFGTWMRGIVRNKWREWVRKNSRYYLSDDDLAIMDADIAKWQGEKATGDSSAFDRLDQCLKRLPDNLRETIYAFYYEGRTGEEVSELLGVAPAAVRKRLQRARQLLKECVDRKIEAEATTSESF